MTPSADRPPAGDPPDPADPRACLVALRGEIAAGRLIPYLGPGVLAVALAAAGQDTDPTAPPTSPRDLAGRLAARSAVPGRLRGNPWSSAQYIETHRHRVTLDRLMAEIFANGPPPLPFHHWLAGLPGLPLVVDTWYDDTLARAFLAREPGPDGSAWGQIQGINRHALGEAGFFRAFDAAGQVATEDQVTAWPRLLYKPHGSLWPAGAVLISDSDYVEALTEIDIQTPIPPVVQSRRQERGTLFLGCRFFDQILRTYARQILKRSGGPRWAILPPDSDTDEGLTRNERRFLEDLDITVLPLPLAEALHGLAAVPDQTV